TLAGEGRKEGRRTARSGTDAAASVGHIASLLLSAGTTFLRSAAVGNSLRTAAVRRTTIGTLTFATSPITTTPVRWTTIGRTVAASADAIAGNCPINIASLRITTTVRSQFVFRQLAVAVPVEFFERLAGRLDFLGRKDSVVVRIQRLE